MPQNLVRDSCVSCWVLGGVVRLTVDGVVCWTPGGDVLEL